MSPVTAFYVLVVLPIFAIGEGVLVVLLIWTLLKNLVDSKQKK